MGHGMTGLLIVEDPKDPVFDAELTLNLRDWRLGSDGQFIELFKRAIPPRRNLRHGARRELAGGTAHAGPHRRAVRLRLSATECHPHL